MPVIMSDRISDVLKRLNAEYRCRLVSGPAADAAEAKGESLYGQAYRCQIIQKGSGRILGEAGGGTETQALENALAVALPKVNHEEAEAERGRLLDDERARAVAELDSKLTVGSRQTGAGATAWAHLPGDDGTPELIVDETSAATVGAAENAVRAKAHEVIRARVKRAMPFRAPEPAA